MKNLIFISFSLVPFSYFTVGGLRVLLVQAAFIIFASIVSVIKCRVLYVDLSFLFAPFVAMLLLSFSVVTYDFSVFFAFTIFIILSYWYVFFDKKSLSDIVRFSKIIYLGGALVAGVGVLLQYYLNSFLGIAFGKIDQFGGGRTAYSFIWQDFSFLSLYLISSIPLAISVSSGGWRASLALVLFVSALTTSARTGVVSFVIYLALLVVLRIVNGIVSGRISWKLLSGFVFFIIICAFTPFVLEIFTGREFTFSSSGRLEGFRLGMDFLGDNFFLGAKFDIEYFVDNVSLIPHNLFLYFLIMGGFVFFLVFSVWFFLVLIGLRFADADIVFSLVIVFLGCQFIPSFFSGYFIASLLGLAFASGRVRYPVTPLAEAPQKKYRSLYESAYGYYQS